MSTLLGTVYANGLTVAPATIADLETAPAWATLAAEYADETLIAGMPAPIVQWSTYRALEAAGLLRAFSATIDGELVGFVSVLAALLPRYGEQVATTESFFVAKAHRRSGAGLRLLRAAEGRAREIGSRGLMVSAPFAGDLFQVLPRLGYGEVARVFFKPVSDG